MYDQPVGSGNYYSVPITVWLIGLRYPVRHTLKLLDRVTITLRRLLLFIGVDVSGSIHRKFKLLDWVALLLR
jgi:hypothetical protein